MTALPFLRFDHLVRLTDTTGVFEHATHSTSLWSHGYTIVDNARALMVTARSNNAALDRVARVSLSLLSQSLDLEGRVKNRLSAYGVWDSATTAGDPLGRVWQGVGVAVQKGSPWLAEAALHTANRLGLVDPEPLRPSAFAGLGAAALLTADPSMRSAQAMAHRARQRLLKAPAVWGPWPEARLSYANARVPEAMMALGDALGDDQLTSRGLMLLQWLAEIEWLDGHWSFTPVGGRGPNDTIPALNQQPVEAAAMADASYLAWELTGDNRWAGAVLDTGFWLVGVNDIGMSLYDRSTGACRTNLEPTIVNVDQEAASTLSGLIVLLRCRDVATRGPRPYEGANVDDGTSRQAIHSAVPTKDASTGSPLGPPHRDDITYFTGIRTHIRPDSATDCDRRAHPGGQRNEARTAAAARGWRGVMTACSSAVIAPARRFNLRFDNVSILGDGDSENRRLS